MNSACPAYAARDLNLKLMLKKAQVTIIILPLMLIMTLEAKSLSAEYLIYPEPRISARQFQYADSKLWAYLRLGLTYLESPKPLSQPEAVSPEYIHPDARGFGTYGLSPEAYEDVRRAYPDFKDCLWQNILSSPGLYELANQAFADLLLKNLQEYIPHQASREQIFDILQKAWNLGLGGFRNGRATLESRDRRAEEFKAAWKEDYCPPEQQ